MNQPQRLGERYELGPVIGRGGMAEVHAGRDIRLGRAVAVKMLRHDLARDPSFQARFRREAQSAAALNHPSIVAVYDTGEEMYGGQPVPYIVMEYVEGTTLRDVLASGNRLMPQRVLEIVAAILGALDNSHRSGIIHRDIKPANVMLTPRGDVKVMDFGIARAIADSSSAMTQTSAVIGTAQYLSPEQARGEQVDSRTDIYSAGCLMYELLTGRPPFVGESPVAVAYQHVREEPVAPSSLNPDISAPIEAITLQALAKTREARYQTASAMRSDIERALAGMPVDAPTPTPTAVTTVRPSGTAGGPATSLFAAVPGGTGRRAVPHRRRTGAYLMMGLAVVLVFAATAYGITKLISPGAAKTAGAVAKVSVPELIGKTEAQARQALSDAKLTTGSITQEQDPTAKANTVLRSDPAVESLVASGSQVSLVISSGTGKAYVPANLIGLGRAKATAALIAAKLQVGTVDTRGDSGRAAGTVLEANPGPGTLVDEGTKVNLIVADGNVAAPDVTKKFADEARSILENLGFRVRIVEQESPDVAAGTVLTQTPVAGPLPLGTAITLTVAKQPGVTASATPGATVAP
jgi:eukaryotic-like serine/threonine-protein kinase